MLIIRQLTTVDKRLELIVGVATGRSRVREPQNVLLGLVWLQSSSLLGLRNCPTPRALPQQSLLGFFFGTDRTPSDSKSLHGLRGGKHRRVATPDPAVQPFSEGLGNTFAAAVRQCGHG